MELSVSVIAGLVIALLAAITLLRANARKAAARRSQMPPRPGSIRPHHRCDGSRFVAIRLWS